MLIKYLIPILLLLGFFLYGMMLSKLIDYMFDDFEEDIGDVYILFEIFFEICLAYGIYYISLESIYYIMKMIRIQYNDSYLMAFSFGIFYNMEKYNHKLSHIWMKYAHI